MVIGWIRDALDQQEFTDDVFLNVVMRQLEDVESLMIEPETEDDRDPTEKEEEEDHFELVDENDYEFDVIE